MNEINNDYGLLMEDTAKLMTQAKKSDGGIRAAMIGASVLGVVLIGLGICLIVL
ncbi:MAG: hypothetical protein IKG17_06350 [Mogibacterium sp.]|jgi:hypothetical protein|nr:hypothetical protein [Mogibacterium sp.]